MPYKRDWDRLGKALENATPVQFNITPRRAFTLCGLLQLALRHPTLPAAVVPFKIAQEMVKSLQERLGKEDPFIAQMIEDGWNEKLDVPVSEFKMRGCNFRDLGDEKLSGLLMNTVSLGAAVELIAEMTGQPIEWAAEKIDLVARHRLNSLSPEKKKELIDKLDDPEQPGSFWLETN